MTLPNGPKIPAFIQIMQWIFTPMSFMEDCAKRYGDMFVKIYIQNQKKFKPERFLEKQFSPYEFLPFGGGVRRCIGSAFALFEMKLALAKILSRYSLALVDETEVKPGRRGLVTAPSRPI